MSMLGVILAVAGWTTALLLLLLLPARARRRTLKLGLRLRSHLRPYLLRRAVEAKLDVPTDDLTHDADAMVDDLCRLARTLTEHDRAQMELGDTMDIGTSDTMPVVETGERKEPS